MTAQDTDSKAALWSSLTEKFGCLSQDHDQPGHDLPTDDHAEHTTRLDALVQVGDLLPITQAPLVVEPTGIQLTCDQSVNRRLHSVMLINPLHNAKLSIDDPRIGATVNGQRCQTCKRDWEHCFGHTSHIDLAQPVINGNYSDVICHLLETSCFRCGLQLQDTGATSHLGDETAGLFHTVPLPVLAPFAAQMNAIRQSCAVGPLAFVRDDSLILKQGYVPCCTTDVEPVQPLEDDERNHVLDTAYALVQYLLQEDARHPQWADGLQLPPDWRPWLQVATNKESLAIINRINLGESAIMDTVGSDISSSSSGSDEDSESEIEPEVESEVESVFELEVEFGTIDDEADLLDTNFDSTGDVDQIDQIDQIDDPCTGETHIDSHDDTPLSVFSKQVKPNPRPKHRRIKRHQAKLIDSLRCKSLDTSTTPRPTKQSKPAPTSKSNSKFVQQLQNAQLLFHCHQLYSTLAQLRTTRGSQLNSLAPMMKPVDNRRRSKKTVVDTKAQQQLLDQVRITDRQVVQLEQMAGCTFGNVVGLVRREQRRLRDAMEYIQQLRQRHQRECNRFEKQLAQRVQTLIANLVFLDTCVTTAARFIQAQITSFGQWREQKAGMGPTEHKKTWITKCRSNHKLKRRSWVEATVPSAPSVNHQITITKHDPEFQLLSFVYRTFFQSTAAYPLLDRLMANASKIQNCHTHKALHSLVCSLSAGGCGANQPVWHVKGVAFTTLINTAVVLDTLDLPWLHHFSELVPYDVYHLLASRHQTKESSNLMFHGERLCWWVVPIAVKALRIHPSIFKHPRAVQYERLVQCTNRLNQQYEINSIIAGTQADMSNPVNPGWRGDRMECVDRFNLRYHRRLLDTIVLSQNIVSLLLTSKDQRWVLARHEKNLGYQKEFPRSSFKVALPSQLTGKHKVIRRNCIGKNTNFAGRLVGIADTSVPLGAIGLSWRMARRIHTKEMVTPLSRQRLATQIREAMSIHPYDGTAERVWSSQPTADPETDPSMIIDITSQTGETIAVTDELDDDERQTLASRLRLGDTVTRTIRTGDFIVLNRSPSLHRHSVLGRRVMVLAGTDACLHINPCDTEPLSGDFDGDVYLYITPTTLRAKVETQLLLTGMGSWALINPQNNSNIFSAIEDIAVGLHLLTSERMLLSHSYAARLLSNLVFAEPIALELDIPAWCQHRVHPWTVDWHKVDTTRPTAMRGSRRWCIGAHWSRVQRGTYWNPCVVINRCHQGCVLQCPGRVSFTTLLSWVFQASCFNYGQWTPTEIQSACIRDKHQLASTDIDWGHQSVSTAASRSLTWLAQWQKQVAPSVVLIDRGRYVHGVLTKAELGKSATSIWSQFIRSQSTRECYLLYHNLTALSCTLLHLHPVTLSLQHLLLPLTDHTDLVAEHTQLLNRSDLAPSPDFTEELEWNERLNQQLWRRNAQRYATKTEQRYQHMVHTVRQQLEDDCYIHALISDRQGEDHALDGWQVMKQSGAKGSTRKLTPLVLAGGLQMVHGGLLVAARDGRQASYFGTQGSLRNQGFVDRSFMRGVSVITNFFQSRTGLSEASDSINEVSSAGILNRLLIRLMMDVRLSQDGTVRDNGHQIIGFCYGHTGQLVHQERRVALFDWSPAVERVVSDALVDLPLEFGDEALDWWAGTDTFYQQLIGHCWQQWQQWQEDMFKVGVNNIVRQWPMEQWQFPHGIVATPLVWVRADITVPNHRGSAPSIQAAEAGLPASRIGQVVAKLLKRWIGDVSLYAELRTARLYLVLALAPRRLWSLLWTWDDLVMFVRSLQSQWVTPVATGENVGVVGTQCCSEILTQATLQLKNNNQALFTTGLLQGVPRFAQLLQHRVLHTDACLSLFLSRHQPTAAIDRLLRCQTTQWLQPASHQVVSQPHWRPLTSAHQEVDVRWMAGPVNFGVTRGWCYQLTVPSTYDPCWFVSRLCERLPVDVGFQLWRSVVLGPLCTTTQWVLELGYLNAVPLATESTTPKHEALVYAALIRPNAISRVIWEGAETTVDVGCLPRTATIEQSPLEAKGQPSPRDRFHTIHLQLHRPLKIVSLVWTIMATTDRCLTSLQTSSVHLVEHMYGVVVARLALEAELFKMLKQVKTVQRRHCRIIAYWMTYNGTVQPLRLTTLHQRCPSLFKQTSFEKNATPFIVNPLTSARDDGRLILSRQMLGLHSGSGTDTAF
jgi:hypothetical protein